MIELSLRKRVSLEAMGARRRSLSMRKIVCQDSTPSEDVILDEALRFIKEMSPGLPVQSWIELLSGELFCLEMQHKLSLFFSSTLCMFD